MRFFTDGWGDEDLLHPPEIRVTPTDPLEVHWLADTGDEDLILRHGSFTSSAPGLPMRAIQGSVLSVAPHRAPDRWVVLMPAWNEHEPTVRLALARILAQRGVGSMLLENAYFGSRHPHPLEEPDVHPIRTVADFMVMGVSAVIEGRGLAAMLRAEGHTVGVAGYSMGGNTAALVAATTDFPVAAAPLAASYSPSPVFLDGILRHGISWGALGGHAEEDRLREVLLRASVLLVEPREHHRSAVVVGARSDAYIPRAATEGLADHWSSDVRWLPGGHATLVWNRKDLLADCVVAAFDRFEAR